MTTNMKETIHHRLSDEESKRYEKDNFKAFAYMILTTIGAAGLAPATMFSLLVFSESKNIKATVIVFISIVIAGIILCISASIMRHSFVQKLGNRNFRLAESAFGKMKLIENNPSYKRFKVLDHNGEKAIISFEEFSYISKTV